MERTVFDSLYRKLNPAQREAVDWIEGPVMVVAGPGTGKTQILTLRIANILLKTQTEPENILALTFTESGVISMRRHLAEIVKGPAYSVVINTFHGFCNDVIKNHPGEFPRIIGSQNITEVDQIAVVKEVIERLPLKELKPFGDPYYYLRTAVSRINTLKSEGVTADAFSALTSTERREFDGIPDLLHERGVHAGKMKGEYLKLLKKIEKNMELARVYAAYQESLAENRLYDYADMIMETLQVLSENKELLLTLQEQHQYLLVDEHQDTNNAQNRVLELLADYHPNPNLFIVGDEKQAIFRFQGASLENFSYFRKKYPEAKLITLTENYRSSQNILDAAESVMPSSAPLLARAGHEPRKIRRFAFSSPDSETYYLGKDIAEKIAGGVAPESIAVLYRDNRDAFPVARMFEKLGVPFTIESDQDILADSEIRKLIVLLRAAHEFGAQDIFIEALHIDFLGIHPLDVYKLMSYATKEKVSVLDAARAPEVLASIGVESAATITDFYARLSAWATSARNAPLADFFESVVRESGFLTHILSGGNPVEALDRLAALYDEIKSLLEKHREYRLADFLGYLDMLAAHNILIKRTVGAYHGHRVRLMTAHKSKGLEFEFVYIAFAADGHWGNKRKPNTLPLIERAYTLGNGTVSAHDALDDERRLFYVALTRGKKEVSISYSRENAEYREQLPCIFLEEIRTDAVAVEDTARYEREFSEKREMLFAAGVQRVVPVKDKEFIAELFSDRGFSVTALNNYLRCPWEYFYTNLLRIPQTKKKHQMYGTAMHGALHDFFAQAKEGIPPKDFLLMSFEHYLLTEPLSSGDYVESFKKGTAALDAYYDRYHETWRTNVLTEFNIPAVYLTPELRLTGKIDKMEFLGSGNEVNVVDYKTGAPKTRGVIEGTTKDSSGDIKRQLVFYNLLLSLYEHGRYRMVSGEIDFVEPDLKGQHRKEAFSVLPKEVEELKALIEKTASEIRSAVFWDRTCGEPECEFCAIRRLMG